jgi:putative redox protein
MPRISVRHEHDAHYHLQIGRHGLVVDQPIGEGGAGLGPTPTELFVGSLAACVAYYAGRYLQRHDISTAGFRVDCDFQMSRDAPARVSSISIEMALPADFPLERREVLLRIAERCTVHNSLRSAPEVQIRAIGAERAA